MANVKGFLPAPKLAMDCDHAVYIDCGGIEREGRDRIRTFFDIDLINDSGFVQFWKSKQEGKDTFDIDCIPTTKFYQLAQGIGWNWLQDGRPWPRRFNTAFKKTFGFGLPPEYMGNLGDIASRHCMKDGEFINMDFTRTFEWEDGDFGDSGSCFWGERSKAREMLSEGGCFAMRLFRQWGDLDSGFARAWIGDRAIYHDGHKTLAYIVFNGYGKTALEMARILARHLGAGMSYHAITLKNNGRSDGTLYINGGTGFIVGPKELIKGIYAHDFEIADGSVHCCNCQCLITDIDDQISAGGDIYCPDCIDKFYEYCHECDTLTKLDYLTYVTNQFGENDGYCPRCKEKYLSLCAECGEVYRDEDGTECEGERYCEECAGKYIYVCDDCGDKVYHENAKFDEHSNSYCEECYIKRTTKECDYCHGRIDTETDHYMYVWEERNVICEECEREGRHLNCGSEMVYYPAGDCEGQMAIQFKAEEETETKSICVCVPGMKVGRTFRMASLHA